MKLESNEVLLVALTALVIGISCSSSTKAASTFQRGDSNGSGRLDVSDVITTLGFLFEGTAQVDCEDAADANDDGKVDISDPLATLATLFLNGDPLPEPYRDCGEDPTLDSLGCTRSPECEGTMIQPELDQWAVTHYPSLRRGDCEFYGHGPDVDWRVAMRVSPDQLRLQAQLWMRAEELDCFLCFSDGSLAESASPWIDVWTAPQGCMIRMRDFAEESGGYMWEDGWRRGEFGSEVEFVERVVVFADTDGCDVGRYTRIEAHLRAPRIQLDPVTQDGE